VPDLSLRRIDDGVFFGWWLLRVFASCFRNGRDVAEPMERSWYIIMAGTE
jgi:hypothetical protein